MASASPPGAFRQIVMRGAAAMRAGLAEGCRAARGRTLCLVAAIFLGLPAGTAAAQGQHQNLHALAVLDPGRTVIRDLAAADGGGVDLRIGLSQPVPYRISFMDGPPRLVMDFREVDFAGVPPAALNGSEHLVDLRWGPFRDGWSRMVAVLDGPMRLVSADERSVDGGAMVSVRLAPEDIARFTARVAEDTAEAGSWDIVMAPAAPADATPPGRQRGERPLRIAIDPGHGGIDPGAEVGRTVEAALVLAFSVELADRLRRAGMEVILTRTNDVFVPLEARISVARAARADVLLSIHADALEEGKATGATIYRLADRASDTASAQLAERHDRGDILSGVDLTGNDDEVAGVLLDLARTETGPRAESLARALKTSMADAGIRLHRHPIQEAAFSVLKSADIPSLLIEIGFLSSADDRARFQDPEWRAAMQGAILAGLSAWAISDAVEADLIRQ